MKILKLTDSVEIKHDGVSVFVAPMSKEQKAQVSSCVKMFAGKEIADYEAIGIKTIQFSVKSIKGIKGYDNKDYELSFDGDCLSEDCAYELLGAFSSTPIVGAISQVVAQNLSPIDGIEFKVKSEKK